MLADRTPCPLCLPCSADCKLIILLADQCWWLSCLYDVTTGVTLASVYELQGHIILCIAAWPLQGNLFGVLSTNSCSMVPEDD